MGGASYPKIRNLDGAYFRVERDGRWLSLCFTDLTEAERELVMEHRSLAWTRGMVLIMARTLREVGDQLDVVRGEVGP